MTSKIYDLHIGESSWDIECLRNFGIKPKKSFLHNDYFQKNPKSGSRIKNFIKIFFLVLVAVLRNKRVIFTSINSDALLVQIVFLFYNKCFFLIPNACGYKSETHIGAKIYRIILKSYLDRVLVSDEVTYNCLSLIKPSKAGNIFSLSKCRDLPRKRDANFLIVLPAPETHKDSRADADMLYDFHLDIFLYFLKNGIKVNMLTHPRDRGHTIQKLKASGISLNLIIEPSQIQHLKAPIYVSGFSSLCLNKRYGGKHGIWARFNGKHILKKEFQGCERFLVDIENIL